MRSYKTTTREYRRRLCIKLSVQGLLPILRRLWQYFLLSSDPCCPVPSGVIQWVGVTNPWGKLKWPCAITRLTAHFMCGLMSDLVICKFRKYGHTWHRMSLLRPGVIKQHKTKPLLPNSILRMWCDREQVSWLMHIYYSMQQCNFPRRSLCELEFLYQRIYLWNLSSCKGNNTTHNVQSFLLILNNSNDRICFQPLLKFRVSLGAFRCLKFYNIVLTLHPPE